MSIDREKGEWPTDMLPSGWQWAAFTDAFQDHTSSERKVKQGDYLSSGAVPIIDQGQEIVGGYTNDTALAYEGPLPAIIFGDHTRCIKVFEQRFAQGADGVRVLTPTIGLTPSFAFLALKMLRLPDKGYSRHFKFLKASEFPVPPIAEQVRIVAKIDELTTRSRRAKEALDAVPPLLDQLRQSILAAAFRGDLTADWRAKNPDVEPADKLLARIRAERRSRWEAAEFGKMQTKDKLPTDDRWKEKYKEPVQADALKLPELPDRWCWATMEELSSASRPVIYGIIKAGPDFPGGVPYVRVTEVAAGRIVLSELPRCDPRRAAKFTRSILAAGDILVSKDGTIGKVVLVPPELEGGNINQHVLRVAPVSLMDRFYLAHMVESPQCQRWMTGEARGMALQGVNVEDFRRMPIPLAPLSEQQAIVDAIAKALGGQGRAAISVSRARNQIAEFERAILAKAFRGELVPQDPTDEPASVLLDRIRTARSTTPASPKRPRARKPDPASVPPTPTPSPAIDPATLEDEVFAALWTLGPLDKDAAVRRVAAFLRDAGKLDPQQLHEDHIIHTQLLAAIGTAVKAGRLDRPKRGHVRACKADATAYTPEDWRHALVASLGPEPIDREQAIRNAAEWARDHLGLAFARLRTDGHIVEGLRAAITSAIRRGEIVGHAKRISRPG